MKMVIIMNTEIYRVYDTEKKKWIIEECVLSPKGELYKTNKQVSNAIKLISFHNKISFYLDINSRFILQRSILLQDKTDKEIYEGDILKTTKNIIGVVSYSTDLAAYVLLEYKSNKYYPLSSDICKQSRIIGNIIDNEDLLYL